MNFPKEFLRQKNLDYLEVVKNSKDFFSYGGIIREHLGLPGAYWSITSCYIIKKEIPEENKQELFEWVMSCQNKDGGFGGNQNHDSNITCTLYAMIITLLFDKFEELDQEKIYDYIMSLYDEQEGSFKGDIYGEIDGRFCYSAIYCLKLLKKQIPDGCLNFFKRCFNYDGGFGGTPQAESHAAYVFCSVGALAIMDKLQEFDLEGIKRFLSIRQTSKGGFNGRPEKLPDVCYSWWVFASIRAITDEEIINIKNLEEYILSCQDKDEGGFTDRPGNGHDVFHTFFALASLSLIDKNKFDLVEVDPIYAIPRSLVLKYISQ